MGANLNYNMMSETDIYPKQDELQSMLERELANGSIAKKSIPELNKWQSDLQQKVVEEWWNLSDYLIVKYNDGFLNEPTGKMGKSIGYPKEWAESISLNGDIHPIQVERKAVAYPTRLPSEWVNKEWRFTPAVVSSLSEEPSCGCGCGHHGKKNGTDVEAKVSNLLNEAAAEAKSIIPAQLKDQLGLDNMLLAEQPSSVNASRSMFPFTLLMMGLTLGFLMGRSFGRPNAPQQEDARYEPLL